MPRNRRFLRRKWFYQTMTCYIKSWFISGRFRFLLILNNERHLSSTSSHRSALPSIICLVLLEFYDNFVLWNQKKTRVSSFSELLLQFCVHLMHLLTFYCRRQKCSSMAGKKFSANLICRKKNFVAKLLNWRHIVRWCETSYLALKPDGFVSVSAWQVENNYLRSVHIR